MRVQIAGLLPELVRMPDVVVVLDGDIGSFGPFQERVEPGVGPEVRPAFDQGDFGAVERPDVRYGSVGRRVVEDEDFKIAEGLVEAAPEGVLDIIPGVIGTDENGDFWHGGGDRGTKHFTGQDADMRLF